MAQVNRRSLLALGAAAAPALAFAAPSAAQDYGPEDGTELLPGVRQVDLGEHEAIIPGYSRVRMRDILIEPGVEFDPFPMENDMVCHMTAGELEVIQDGTTFTMRTGEVWTCAEGTEEGGHNRADVLAVMRVTDLVRG
jgi:quercetin dioxygenase-like cupin family protein